MIARLVLTGHRRLLAAHLLALSLLGAVLGGMLGTLVRARGAAAALRSAPLMTTHLLSRISQLGGLINFTTMVVVIAGVVALMLSGTIASFTVEGFAAASRSLRLLGASRRRVRAGLVAGVLPAAAPALVAAVALAPLVSAVFRMILTVGGLDTRDLTVSPEPAATAGAWAALVVLDVLALWWRGRGLAGIDADAPAPRPAPAPRTAVRRRACAWGRPLAGAAGGAVLVRLLREPMSVNRANAVPLGSALAAVVLLWALSPLLVRAVGALVKRAGAIGLATGGLLVAHRGRVCSLALVGSLLTTLGTTSYLLAAASSTVVQWEAARTLRASAWTASPVPRDEAAAAAGAGVLISPFDADSGWVLEAEPASTALLRRIDPAAMGAMVVEGQVVAGSLGDVTGTAVAADADGHELGERLLMHDDAGNRIALTVVALVNPLSALAGALVVDDSTFPVADPRAVVHRACALAPGGIDAVRRAAPSAEWMTQEEQLSRITAHEATAKALTVASMVGPVAAVVLLVLVRGAAGLADDLRVQVGRLRRLGMSRAAVAGALVGVGLTTALVMVVVSGLSVLPPLIELRGLLEGFGVDYPLTPPGGMIAGLWAAGGACAVAGLLRALRERR